MLKQVLKLWLRELPCRQQRLWAAPLRGLLPAKLLKFRNAVSVGAATAHNSLENENMKRNPFFKTFYEKAAKEGRKVKFSERLKAALQFSAAKHEARMIHKKNIDNILASYRQR